MAFRKLTDFIQADVITGYIIDKLRARLTAKGIVEVSTNGALGKGSSFKFTGIGDVTIQNYTGADLTLEDATSTGVVVTLDKFPIGTYTIQNSDIDEASAFNMAMNLAEDVAGKVEQDIDKAVLLKIQTTATDVATLGVTTAPISINTGAEALAYVGAIATKLRELNIETDGVIVLPAYLEILLASELKGAYSPEVADGIRTGKFATLFGYDIVSSNNLPNGVAGGLAADELSFVAGRRKEAKLILGYTEMEMGIPHPTQPAQINRIGQVYGTKLTNTGAWINGVVKNA